MKTITCKQMGGPCDYKISAETPKEMLDRGMEHVKKDHPKMLETMEKMSEDENKEWNDSFMKTWETTP